VEDKMRIHRIIWICLATIIATIIQTGSSPADFTNPLLTLQFNGIGPAQESIQWNEPAILYITANQGSQPFVASLNSGETDVQLENTQGEVNDFHSFDFKTTDKVALSIQGDRNWTVTVYPVDPHYFYRLMTPGSYQGDGSAVILLEGKIGVATFDKDRAQNFKAWAYGPGGVSKELTINPGGDYKGKSVLPKETGWIVISARGPWSVEIQLPCCEVPAGY
jgi:hypothetical protein